MRIMVATPDPSSITDTYSSIKILKNKFNVSDNHLIVNKVTGETAFKTVVRTISETAERFLNCHTKVLGAVNNDKKSSLKVGNIFSEGKNFQTYKNILKVLSECSENVINKLPLISNGHS